MNQKDFIYDLLQKSKDAIIIGSLGTISYDLDNIQHDNKIPVRGAMGCAMAVGLGYALAKPEKEVIVLIGDGAFLMKMGTIATMARYNLPNLKIYILNNNQHKSTGGQETNFKYIKRNLNFGLEKGCSLNLYVQDEVLS